MKIKKIITYDDPRLRQPNADITEPWGELHDRVGAMFKLMYRAGTGVGLAAPQVGWNVRLFVMNPDNETFKPDQERVYWNPKIVRTYGDPVEMEEGCLSRHGKYGRILRFEKLLFRAETKVGAVDRTLEGFEAQIVQHEMDHLDAKVCWENFIK